MRNGTRTAGDTGFRYREGNVQVSVESVGRMDVLVIGGGGTIGSTVAYTLSVLRPATNVVLADPRTDHTEGHAIDLRHSTCHVAHPAGRPEFGDGAVGSVTVESPRPELVSEADCIVVTASISRPIDGAERGGRYAFLQGNLEVAEDVGSILAEAEPTPTVVVSNPLDRITHRLWEASGWPRRSIVGYSLSETARFADVLSRIADVPPGEIDCPVLGEHGEHLVPAFSRATAGDEPLELSADEREHALEFARNAAYEVIKRRGGADTSRWVSARGIACLVVRILEGGVEPICLSTPLDGEYGLDGGCLSVPLALSPDGVERIIEWELSKDERRRLAEAHEAVWG